MRNPIREQVPQHLDASFDCEVISAKDYGTRWHFHPEAQITLAVRSQGYRIVGDNISPLHDGDCVLIGPDVPHVWQQDRGSKEGVRAIVLRFDTNMPALQQPEMERIRQLLKRARRGLEIKGRALAAAAASIDAIAAETGARRVISLLSLLDTLSRSTELKPLASAAFQPDLDADDTERMGRIMRFIEERLTDEIAREEVARVAALSCGAFSRYFKSRTGRSLPQYVNELRIGRACRMLVETGESVTNIAFDCGFRNLANFNRWFLELTKLVPREYRRRMAVR